MWTYSDSTNKDWKGEDSAYDYTVTVCFSNFFETSAWLFLVFSKENGESDDLKPVFPHLSTTFLRKRKWNFPGWLPLLAAWGLDVQLLLRRNWFTNERLGKCCSKVHFWGRLSDFFGGLRELFQIHLLESGSLKWNRYLFHYFQEFWLHPLLHAIHSSIFIRSKKQSPQFLARWHHGFPTISLALSRHGSRQAVLTIVLHSWKSWRRHELGNWGSLGFLPAFYSNSIGSILWNSYT